MKIDKLGENANFYGKKCAPVRASAPDSAAGRFRSRPLRRSLSRASAGQVYREAARAHSRYSAGATPFQRLKARENVLGSEKPSR